MNELKQVSSLFHTTDKIENIRSIIQGGFTPSYSKEIFGNNLSYISMVSFSNVLLLETKTQINYGDYSIGMTKDWCIKNNLQPVFYTYENSYVERSLRPIRQIFDVAGIFSDINKHLSKNKIDIKFKGIDFSDIGLKTFDTLIRTNFDHKQSKIIEHFLTEISEVFVYYELYSKRINAKNKVGEEFICFNDREWRYIPDFKYKFLYEPDPHIYTLKEDDEEYKKRLREHKESLLIGKEQLSKHILKFDLDDIKSIVVKNDDEIENIFDLLKEVYGEQFVLQRIFNGSLLVTSYDQLYNNF